jgi:lysophospholipase L1-like esterase
MFFLDVSPLAYGIFETKANSLILNVSNTLPGLADLSIEDESGVTTYEAQPGESVIVHSMSSAAKRVTITSGGQSKINEVVRGVFIDKITFNESAVQIHPTNKRIAIYGDSIVCGSNVRYPSAQAWPVLLRESYSAVVNAYGYRSLHDDASTLEKRARLVSEISSPTPEYIWLAIGTNDYRFELWPAQEFGEAYASLLVALHVSNSQAIVFAQSPIHRVQESPNSFGDSLESYRQQIAEACLERSDWCTFVDGTDPAFPQLDELDQDGVHLTTLSSAKYATAVLNIINK